jgi:hypothetical protein
MEMLMKKKYVLLILFTFALTIPAIGQTTTGDREKTENIEHLMKIMGMEKLQQAMLDQILVAMKPMLPQAPAGDEQLRKMVERFSELISEEFKKLDFMSMNINLYDQYFTKDEIKGLIQFYESPVGQKAIQVLPAITQEGMKRGMELGSTVAPKALLRLAEEFPELKSLLQRPRKE